jgi:CrcB protein
VDLLEQLPASLLEATLATEWVAGFLMEPVSNRFHLDQLTQRTDASPNWRYLIPIGFIGAYTTFSTFEYETLRTVQDGQILMAFANVGLSVLAGFAAVWLGVVVGRVL